MLLQQHYEGQLPDADHLTHTRKFRATVRRASMNDLDAAIAAGEYGQRDLLPMERMLNETRDQVWNGTEGYFT